ncbi:MAG: hypothetical protein GYA57_04000 [Myxococcales bacterium]|nr:hypothetical protein [Myxococcales bacterium]
MAAVIHGNQAADRVHEERTAGLDVLGAGGRAEPVTARTGAEERLDGLCLELDEADRLVRLRASGGGGCDATANILEEYEYDERSRRTVRPRAAEDLGGDNIPTSGAS